MDKFVIKKARYNSLHEENDSMQTSTEETEAACTSTKSTTCRKFRTEWLHKFGWLEEKNGKAFCIACDKSLCHVLHLKIHETKAVHLKNVQLKKHQTKLDAFQTEEQQHLSKQVHFAELTLVMFCICHNLPFLLMDFLPALVFKCPDSKIAKELKCGRTKSTQLTNTLGIKAKNKILSSLKQTKFSLIVDETTDISTKKSLVLVVRYYDNLSKIVQDMKVSRITRVSQNRFGINLSSN